MEYIKNKIYMVFWWKNLDLDSNLYNSKNRIKKASLILRNRPYTWTLPLRCAKTRQQILSNRSWPKKALLLNPESWKK